MKEEMFERFDEAQRVKLIRISERLAVGYGISKHRAASMIDGILRRDASISVEAIDERALLISLGLGEQCERTEEAAPQEP